MAHSLSAKKRVRQNATHRLRNRRHSVALRGTIKSFLQTVQTGNVDEAQAQLSKVYKAIDQSAARGTVHKNAAARYKARLSHRLGTARRTKAGATA
ncbi:MAG: 30S ribosomal protein S20 [Phycisphaeraceae bacterium]